MRDKIISNDYIGFTFNGIHSSQLGIIRTSDGSRFNENLLPTMQDKTVQVPGGDGTYYFGSWYTQKPINISFAFDDMTELEYTELKKWLGDKKVHAFIFDESPYKAYQAKVTGSATIKHIPFTEDGKRVYKGEGSVQFTAFNPFARSVFKFLREGDEEQEWIEASRMIHQTENGKSYDVLIGNNINLYNAGDKESHSMITLAFSENKIPAVKIYLSEDSTKQLSIKEIVKTNERDAYVKINSRLNLIEGYDENMKKTGSVYNSVIEYGSFFTIPTGYSTLVFDGKLNSLNKEVSVIEYDYYYF